MSTLVLGGTSWLGGRVAVAAVARGEDVTCLARGEAGSAPDGVRFVRADRGADGAYDAVQDRDWDLVVDVSWQPGFVRRALAALGDRAGHWVYVSSCSVYADQSVVGADESTPLLAPLPDDAELADREVYAEAKVRCEQLCSAAVGDRLLVARSGLIAGYGDLSDRFGYWVGRLALAARDGGPVLVPTGFRDAPAQAVGVDDLASWMVGAGLDRTVGVLDAVGQRWTCGDVLDAAVAATGFAGRLVEAPPPWLTTRGVEEFMGPRSIALWMNDPAFAGFSARDGSAAEESGLHRSALESLTADSLRWELEQGLDRARRAGLDRPDELELVAELDSQPAL